MRGVACAMGSTYGTMRAAAAAAEEEEEEPDEDEEVGEEEVSEWSGA